uniref:WDR11 second beta-propeller domain-containing protein n=1 Tax=Romanomermis culicivorax TaxID=13658 RepID=A0A915JXW6_ROMCU
MKLKPVTKVDQTKDAAENEHSYELAANTEPFRITKNCQLASLALSPSSEINLCMLSTNGKLIFYDLSTSFPSTAFQISFDGANDETLLTYVRRDEKIGQTLTKKVKFLVKCVTTPLAQKPSALKLCPKPAGPGRQYVAVGSFDGSVQIVDIFASDIERQFCVHNCPIICLEWVLSDGIVSAASIKVSCANVNSTPSMTTLSKTENSVSVISGPYRNEIYLTNIKTGFSRALRRNDDLVDDFSIKMIRVSHFGTFLAVTFDGRQPMEIWDMKSARLLRRMARTCPLIIDICWSNKHHSENQIHIGNEEEIDFIELLIFLIVSETNTTKQTVYRENLVILDNENRLYHVVVKGVHVRDGKQVNSQCLNNATVTCMTWKGEILAFGYSDGRMSIWNLETKKFDATKLNSSLGLGPVEKIRFSTGVGGVSTGDFSLLALHSSGRLMLWNAFDISNPLVLYDEQDETVKILDADLLSDDISPILLTSDGCLRIYSGYSNLSNAVKNEYHVIENNFVRSAF